ncbi:MAG: Nif3-like dinuclear metal center hexameric protein [Suipraeoptans sp.]
MNCQEIIKIIEANYDKNYALDWDNVGLLVGRSDREVRTIYIALDATEDVINHAIAEKADFLITHHPMIFNSIKTVTDEDFIGNKIIRLIENNISYYAMHTNYDVVGMADLAGEILGLEESKPLEITSEDATKGIGKVADLQKPLFLGEYAKLVKKQFNLDNVRIFGNLNTKIVRVAISPGSGNGMTDEAIREGANLLITGDISHHQGIDSVDRGLNIIDAGHYGLEHIFIKDIEEFLSKNIKGVNIKLEPINHPFKVI